ncbi:hypothetical protein HYT23_05540 [Candidatus Pacearchaeota archaeon]|nr:hypothetical protein [Candidatus Pacearchaeota archaeon]
MEKGISQWLKEGKQSKITPRIKKIAREFKESELEKIFRMLKWIDTNISSEKNHKKILRIFASRSADQLIKEKNDTGCHDTTLLTVTFLRTLGIPSKYVLGIDKMKPTKGGHCVAEAYIGKRWVLIDPTFFQLNLIPSRSSFYRDNHVIKKGLDSWDCGIKTVDDWNNTSKELIKKIKISKK